MNAAFARLWALLVFTWVVAVPTASAQPACQPGTDISSYLDSGVFTGNLCGSGDDSAGSCGTSGEEEAYFFTATVTGTVEITTNGTSFDSILYARADACNGCLLYTSPSPRD